MKKFLALIANYIKEFIDPSPKTSDVVLKTNQILQTIKEAQKKQEAVHAIYLDKSFTGDIVKYDKEAGKLILKNFKENMSVIITITDIKRLTVVPHNVKKSQKTQT